MDTDAGTGRTLNQPLSRPGSRLTAESTGSVAQTSGIAALLSSFPQPAFAHQRPAEDELHLGVDRAQVVPGPAPDGVEDRGIDPHEKGLALAHFRCRASRC